MSAKTATTCGGRLNPTSSSSRQGSIADSSAAASTACFYHSGSKEKERFTAFGQLGQFLRPEETLRCAVLSRTPDSEDISPEQQLDDTSVDIVLDVETARKLMQKFSFFNKQYPQSSPYALMAWTNQRVIWLARDRDGLKFEAVDAEAPVLATVCKNDLG